MPLSQLAYDNQRTPTYGNMSVHVMDTVRSRTDTSATFSARYDYVSITL